MPGDYKDNNISHRKLPIVMIVAVMNICKHLRIVLKFIINCSFFIGKVVFGIKQKIEIL